VGADAAHILVVIVVGDMRNMANALATGEYCIETAGLIEIGGM